MGFFGAFCLLIAAGCLVSAFLRERIKDRAAYRKALTLLIVALILYYPISELFYVGIYLSFIARPVGFVLAVISFARLCLAVGAPDGAGK